MFLILVLLVIPTFLFLIQRWYKTRVTNFPPGPKGLPIIGNLHQLDDSQPIFDQFSQLSQKYGPLVHLQLGCVPHLIVSSAKMAKEIFKVHDLAFSGKPTLTGLQKLSYNHNDLGFSPYTDRTKELKKLFVTQLLSPRRVQSFRPVREKEVMGMIEKINNFANDSEVVNLSEILLSLTSTVICRIAFGKTYSSDHFAISKFYNLFSEGQEAYGAFYISDYFPCTRWIDILTGKIAQRDKTFKELDAFVEKIINEHKDSERDIKSGQEDIIDVLLRIQKEGSSTVKLTPDSIKALVIVDTFTAGTDTTASALTWAMTELLKNPEAMKRLQKEIRDLHKNKSCLNEDDVQSIPYLQAVLKETMRMHPPVPLLPRKTTEFCNINGYTIQPNTIVYVNAWAIGRDPESWDKPDQFLPERFLGSSIDFRGQDFELVPFGGGRRGCPGLTQAIATLQLALANLVYVYNWDLPNGMNEDDIDMDVKPGVTVHKKTPLCLLPKRWF